MQVVNATFTNPQFPRIVDEAGAEPVAISSAGAGAAIEISGKRARVINCEIHNTAASILGSASANDSEIYGNLIYEGGWRSTADRQFTAPIIGKHGHTLYLQNSSGVYKVHRNLLCNQTGDLLHLYATNAVGVLYGFDVDSNIFCIGDELVFGGFASAVQNARFTNNIVWNDSVYLGFEGVNEDIVITGNTFILPSQHVRIQRWSLSLEVQNNTFITPHRFIQYRPEAGATVIWDNNTYYALPGSQVQSFMIKDSEGTISYLTFAEWQAATGFDTNSTYIEGTPPDTVTLIDNQYDNDRALIAIQNWSAVDSVSVDLSSLPLTIGRQYRLRCATQLRQAGITFVYDGNPVSVPMCDIDFPLETPLWWNAPEADAGIWYETCLPKFGAFVLEKVG